MMAALPKALANRGHRVMVVVPRCDRSSSSACTCIRGEAVATSNWQLPVDAQGGGLQLPWPVTLFGLTGNSL